MNLTKVYLLTILLVTLTGSLGVGFALAFNAHNTVILVVAVLGLLVYIPIVAKIVNALAKEVSK
jgi:nucleoside permease NupC